MLHTTLNVLNVLAAIVFFLMQRRTKQTSKKIRSEALVAIAAWKKEVIRQLYINDDYRRQRNALRFQVEQSKAREFRLEARLTRAEKLLNRVNMVHFTRRPPPKTACALYLKGHLFGPVSEVK